jgi:single-strand DNA-binding protein
MKVTVQALGIMGRDPELKFAKSGKAWAKFPIAVTERKKDGDEWVDGDTAWYDVITFGTMAEQATDNLRKGNRVLVQGTLKRSEWTNDAGETKVSMEITADTVGLVPFAKKQTGPRKVARDDVAPW